VSLGDASTDVITIYGGVLANTTQNPNFDWSPSTGTFKTGTGAVTIGGDTTISGAKTFTTGTGNVTVKGDLSIDAGSDFDMSGGGGTFATGTGTVSILGTVSVAADKNIACVTGTTAVDYSLGSGIFKTTTGAVTIGGHTTISGTKTLTTGTGLVTIKGTLECEGNQIDDSGGAAAITFDGSQNTTVTGDLTVSGTHTFSDASITGDLDIVGTDLQATTGTLNISKTTSMTTIKGTLNVDEAVTLDTTLVVAGATTVQGATTLGNAKADTVTFYGDVAANGAQNPDINFSGSSGTFLTSTGAGTLGCSTLGISGDVTVAAGKDIVLSTTGYVQSVIAQLTNIKAHDGTACIVITDSTAAVTISGHVTMDTSKNVLCSAGSTAVDWSLGTGAFDTTTGTNQLNGDVSIASGKNFDMSAGAGTFTTGTGNVTISGDMSIDAGKDFDMSAGAGTFATGTGTVGINGTTTFATAVTITSGTGSAIGGVMTFYRNASGHTSFVLTPGTSMSVSEDVTIEAAHTLTTGTGDTTISGDIDISGHKDGMEFMVDGFDCPAPGTDWTRQIDGCHLAASLTTKKCWIPLNFLQIGDEIISYKLVGDCTETNALTLDCKLVRVNKADPITTTDVAGGGIVQHDANGNFDVLATLGAAETVATDKQYVLEIEGTTAVADTITVMGAEVVVNRK